MGAGERVEQGTEPSIGARACRTARSAIPRSPVTPDVFRGQASFAGTLMKAGAATRGTSRNGKEASTTPEHVRGGRSRRRRRAKHTCTAVRSRATGGSDSEDSLRARNLASSSGAVGRQNTPPAPEAKQTTCGPAARPRCAYGAAAAQAWSKAAFLSGPRRRGPAIPHTRRAPRAAARP